jgi:type IV pilus assembly protein PilW
MNPLKPFTARPPLAQRGAGIIEVMVGILIGMVVVLVIYNTLVVTEAFKRNTIGISDAQITGQLAQFVLNREIASSGNGVMSGINELARCDEWRLRPIPALIGDGGGPNVSDNVTVFYSNAPRILHPVSFGAAGAAPTPYPVISPNGFKVNDWVIATETALGATNCTLVLVTGITQHPSLAAYPPADVGGRVALSYTLKAGTAFSHTTGSRAFNLGDRVTRTLYSVDAAKKQLNSLDDNPGLIVAATPVPVAQNVVLLKVQYGIDADGDALGLIDCWTSADNSNTCGNGVDYSDTTFKATPAPATMAARIRSIKAIRIAMVIRSDDIVKQDPVAHADLVGQSAVLFTCPASIPNCTTISINNTVLQDYGRYRIYETTIPLRNSLWHPI